MMTGLPEGSYANEDVAKLVWRYLPRQNLHSLYYNVMVLPLQRRVRNEHCTVACWVYLSLGSRCFSLLYLQAFVHFNNWDSCCDFAQSHIRNPVSVGGCPLSIHFVLQDMQPGFSEVLKLVF